MAKTSFVVVDVTEPAMIGSTVGLLMAAENTGRSVWATEANRLLSTGYKEYVPLSDKEIALYTQLYGDYWGKK